VSSTYVPEWKGPIEGYVMNQLAKQLWRVRPLLEHEDAMQEAYVVFLRCAARYPLMDTPQHFMALFKVSWANEFTDWSNKATNARKAMPMSDLNRMDEDGEMNDAPIDSVGETDNMGALSLMVKQAPREVLMVLSLFLNAPGELLELAQSTWRAQGKYNAGGERWAEKVLGLPVGSAPLQPYNSLTGKVPASVNPPHHKRSSP